MLKQPTGTENCVQMEDATTAEHSSRRNSKFNYRHAISSTIADILWDVTYPYQNQNFDMTAVIFHAKNTNCIYQLP